MVVLRARAFLLEGLTVMFVTHLSIFILMMVTAFISFPLSVIDSMPFLILFGTEIGAFFLALDAVWNETSLGHRIMGVASDSPTQLGPEFVRQSLKFLPWGVWGVFLFWSLAGERYIPMAVLWGPALFLALSGLCYALGKEFFHNLLSRSQYHKTETSPDMPRWYLRVVVTGIFALLSGTLFLPSFVGACDREPIYSAKSNMHTLQTIVETYGMDSGGLYPENVETLYTVANQSSNPYWKDFKNPYSKYTGLGKAYANEGAPPLEGLITYAISPDYKTYKIQGYDEKAEPLMERRDRFILTNGE